MSSRREKFRKQVRPLALAGVALALAAVALVAPGSPARAFSILGPAMTVANGNSVIAVQTADDGLRFYWNQHGTDNWYGEQVAGAGTTYSPPAITVVGDDVVIAAEGPLNSMYVYWQAFGASGWTSKPVAGIRTTYSQPAIQADGTSSVIAAEGANNSLRFYWTPALTVNWTGENVAGAGTTYSAPAEIVHDNSVNIAAEGPDDSLDFYWAVNGTATWGPEVVAGAGAGINTAPAMIYTNGTVQIFASDLYADYGFGTVLSYSALNGTANWIPQEVPVGALNAPAVVAYPYVPGSPGGVHLVSNAFGAYMVVMTEADGSFDWQGDSSMCPPAGLAGSGCSVGNPSAVMNGGLLNIASEDGNGNLIFFWQDSSGNFHEETVDTAANLN
jgi:hypothetical protein